LLDPYYSSAHFRVEHDLFSMSRIEKTALVAQWPEGLANIRVCQNDDLGGPNCGTCEKCIRTITTLAALGEPTGGLAAFPGAELRCELIHTMDEYDMLVGHSDLCAWYLELVPLLRLRGLEDIARTLETVLAAAPERTSTGH